MIKAIFFDIDGTLQTIEEKPVIPMSTRLALQKLKDKGIKTFIATGRPKTNLKEFIELADFEFDGWITLNGQRCEIGNTIVRNATLDKEELIKVMNYLEKQNIGCIVAEIDYTYLNLNFEEVKKYTVLNQVDDYHRILDHDVYQLMVFIHEDDVEKEKEFFNILTKAKSARWTPLFMDVIPSDGGKNKGIDSLIEYLGISLEETMAFGDGGNDISMLEHVGIGVAMGNAKDVVKKHANYVTTDIDDDGIYNALVHFGVID